MLLVYILLLSLRENCEHLRISHNQKKPIAAEGTTPFRMSVVLTGKLTPRRKTFSRKTLVRKTFSRPFFFQNEHLSEITSAKMNSCPRMAVRFGTLVRYASIFAKRYGTLFCDGTGTVRLFCNGTGTVST